MAAEPADAAYRVVQIEIRPVPGQPAEATYTCPCPLRGRRCWDCISPAIAGPPPFTVTPLGWALARLRLLWLAITEPLASHGDDD
jgi:hypothetical protein